MSPKRAKQPAQRRNGPDRPSRWSLRLWTALLVALALLGLWWAFHAAAPDRLSLPPTITTAGFEPSIAALIERALADVRAAPRQGAAWGKLGLVLQAHDFEREARRCFEQAERFEPNEPRWPYFAGSLLSQENLQQALARWQRAAELCHDQPDAPRLRLAQGLFQAGQLDEAERHFLLLLRANANHPPAQLDLAKLNHARGRLSEAREQLQSCLQNPFTAKRAHMLLGQVERQLGHTAAAEAAIRTGRSLPPDQSWPDPFSAETAQYRIGRKAWADQAQERLNQGRPGDAQPFIMRLTKDYPEAPEGWLLLGRLRFEQHDCAGAEHALRQHLQLAPDSVNGHAQLGVALLCLERYPEAAAVLQAAIQLKPDFGEAHFNLGFAQARSGRGTEAIQSFREAIRYSPNLVTPYITLADLLNQKGQKQEAQALLLRARQLDPADERATLLLQRVQQP